MRAKGEVVIAVLQGKSYDSPAVSDSIFHDFAGVPASPLPLAGSAGSDFTAGNPADVQMTADTGQPYSGVVRALREQFVPKFELGLVRGTTRRLATLAISMA